MQHSTLHVLHGGVMVAVLCKAVHCARRPCHGLLNNLPVEALTTNFTFKGTLRGVLLRHLGDLWVT